MPYEQLDYPGHKLLMEANTDIEKAFRVHACQKEPWTISFIEAIPVGDWFWDIGACVGSYALLAALKGLRVLAVEPVFQNYATMGRNMALNNFLDRVVMICAAVGKEEGWDWLHLGDLRSGAAGHTLGGGARKRTHHKQLVTVVTLDGLESRTIQLGDTGIWLKIDVDGSEMAVLEGSDGLLRGSRLQVIIIEMRLDLEEDMTKFLSARGWALAERFDERGGQKIGDICYGRFERKA